MDAWLVDYMAFLPAQELIMALRLVVAAVLGGIVGLERGSGDRPAGFRTHILVCVGSALFMLVSIYGIGDASVAFHEAASDMGQRRDSARIAAQVVSGIGFLGAGTILHEGLTIKGLTTAASMWIVSAIGLAVGSGMYIISVAATVITMITLITFRTVEKRFDLKGKSDRRFVRIVTDNSPGVITDITGYLSMNGMRVKNLNVKKDKANNRLVMEIYLKIDTDADVMEIIQGLQEIDGVISLENAK